jgi:hypothetical protein
MEGGKHFHVEGVACIHVFVLHVLHTHVNDAIEKGMP